MIGRLYSVHLRSIPFGASADKFAIVVARWLRLLFLLRYAVTVCSCSCCLLSLSLNRIFSLQVCYQINNLFIAHGLQ